MANDPDPALKAPAKVLGCLRPGYLTVVIWPGLGLADGGIQLDVPMDLVPAELRMPNSQFMVVMKRNGEQIVAIEQQGAPIRSPFSDEELQRRRQQRTGKRLQEILKKLLGS